MFFFHFFHIVNFNFFKKNLGYLSFHLRQFFLVIAFIYCVFILDIKKKTTQDLHMWSLSFSLPIILTWADLQEEDCLVKLLCPKGRSLLKCQNLEK